jgi:drug/metabolite transporter (DMT)-like permease
MTSSESALPSLRSDATHKAGEAVPSSGRALGFLALAIAGLLGQLALVGVFLADNGLDPGELADQIFSSTIAALTFADLMMCAVVFFAWLPREAARVGIHRWWPFALAGLGGLCFAFPLFLYFRERRRIEGPTRAQPAGAF